MGQNKSSNFKDQNQNDPGGDAGGGLKINLKGAASAVPQSGARNALIGGINPGTSQDNPSVADAKQPAPITSAQAKAPQKQQAVSSIKGLDDPLPNGRTRATEIGPAMIAPSSSRRRVFQGIFVAIILGGLAYCFAVPEIREQIFTFARTTKEKMINSVRYQPKKRDKNTSRIMYDKGEKQQILPVEVAPPRTAIAKRSCQALVAGTIGVGKVTVSDRIDLAECYLMIDDFASAEGELTRLRPQLMTTPEKILNGPKASRNLADAYLTLTTIYALQGKHREAAAFTRGKCARWTVSNTCVGKAIQLALRSGVVIGGPGSSNLFSTTGGLDRKAQARLWWAGGLLADKEGQRPTVDQRFTMAMKIAPSDAIALKKNIYESYAVNLYNRREMIKLNSVVNRALGELSRIDRKAKVKLQTLQSLASSQNKTATVRSLLSSEAVAYRARSDFELMEILGVAAVQYKQGENYLRLAKNSRDYFVAKKFDSHPYDRNLSQWEIRMYLSEGENEGALTKLGNYGGKLNKDLFFYHMRGVAYHLMSTDPRFQIQAASEFQTAVKMNRKNWEPLYALGVTLLRANRPDEATRVLKDLETQIKTRGQKYWLEMFKAEWYISKQKYLNAEKILLDWSSQETEYFTPRNLLVQLYKKQGRTSDGMRVEAEIAEITRTRSFATSFEGLSSPLGLMALSERPLE